MAESSAGIIDSEQASRTTSSVFTEEDEDLYRDEDVDTELVGTRFHRVFFKTKVTEPFTGPVGDALRPLCLNFYC
jgi:hypothetical protein